MLSVALQSALSTSLVEEKLDTFGGKDGQTPSLLHPLTTTGAAEQSTFLTILFDLQAGCLRFVCAAGFPGVVRCTWPLRLLLQQLVVPGYLRLADKGFQF